MLRTCQKCSEAIDDDAVFCVSCGAPVLQTVHCPKCGGVINANVKFCKYCAFDLSQPVSSAATAEPKTSQPRKSAESTAKSSPASNAQRESAAVNPASYVSPSGAAFAVLCFFLPWVQFSACGLSKAITGADIANGDGSFWLLPLMGLITIATYFFFKSQKTLFKARPFIIGSSAFALCFLLYKYSNIPSGPNLLGHQVTASDLGIELQFGAFGTIIGFILAIVGCAFMSKAFVIVDQPNGNTSAPTYDSSLDKPGRLRANIAAMWCYLAPILVPMAVFLLAALIAKNLSIQPSGGLFVFFLVIYFASAFAVQTYFIRAGAYESNLFIRFHAFHSIFILAVYWIINILLLSLGSAGFLGAGGISMLSSVFSMGLGLIFWTCSITLAVKSYRGEGFKLPIIGDWAAARSPWDVSQPPSSAQSPPSPHQSPAQQVADARQTDELKQDLRQRKVAGSPQVSNLDTTVEKTSEEIALQRVLLVLAIGGALFVVIVVIIGLSSSGGSAANNARVSTVPVAASPVASPAKMVAANTMAANSTSTTSSSSGRTGYLTTNLNIRSAPNRTASSVGIHFQNAKFRILDETSFDSVDGYSTWYKVHIYDYGCDANGQLGCGKNNTNDSDDGWLNAKYVVLD